MSNRTYSISEEDAKIEFETIIQEYDLIQNQSCSQIKEFSTNLNKVYYLLLSDDKNVFIVG